MLNQTQPSIDPPMLSTLLRHPEFVDGMLDGVQAYQEMTFTEDHRLNWSEENIVRFISDELDEKAYRRARHYDRLEGCEPMSMLHNLGFVISYLDQALSNQ